MKRKCIELFAGAGGLALGLEKAGFEEIGLVEIDKTACDTLRLNRPNWNVIEEDIVKFSQKDLLKEFNLKKGELDLLSGGYPCQSFSYAGKKLGLIAVNGLVFLRLTEALAQLGPSLPAGLKIATFDDYPWNHVLFGGVTTAAQDTLTIAERVVERLSERIDVVTTTVGEAAKLAPKRIEIPGHIEHRASTSR